MINRTNHIPDVLDCLANLSNDEVFTPPKIVNQMLDLLPEEVFRSRETTFLDPFTKSGVFLREITKRLLAYQVPNYKDTASEIEQVTKMAIQDAVRKGELVKEDKDFKQKASTIGDAAIKNHKDAVKFLLFEKQLQDALDHILKKQVFGIAITELTANLARRSLYCSKDASGKYSISEKVFLGNKDGNIRFVPMKHIWKNGNCVYCGASRSNFDRPDDYESHAQLSDGGAQASAIPIYNKFVDQAKKLNPRYLTMIIPSRWMTGGKGLKDFRHDMITDKHICELHDFADSKMCFQGVDIKGGVCYFLRDREFKDGICRCFRHDVNGVSLSIRPLCEDGENIFIREPKLISIKNKVDLTNGSVEDIASPRKPYGLCGDVFKDESKYNLPKMSLTPFKNSCSIIGLDNLKRVFRYVHGIMVVVN